MIRPYLYNQQNQSIRLSSIHFVSETWTDRHKRSNKIGDPGPDGILTGDLSSSYHNGFLADAAISSVTVTSVAVSRSKRLLVFAFQRDLDGWCAIHGLVSGGHDKLTLDDNLGGLHFQVVPIREDEFTEDVDSLLKMDGGSVVVHHDTLTTTNGDMGRVGDACTERLLPARGAWYGLEVGVTAQRSKVLDVGLDGREGRSHE